MSPTIYREGSYRFYFNSREEDRPHIHVKSPDGEAKFWLEPIVALVYSYRLEASDLRKIETIVEARQDEFLSDWHRYFSK